VLSIIGKLQSIWAYDVWISIILRLCPKFELKI
jgi:hypothetical protein